MRRYGTCGRRGVKLATEKLDVFTLRDRGGWDVSVMSYEASRENSCCCTVPWPLSSVVEGYGLFVRM